MNRKGEVVRNQVGSVTPEVPATQYDKVTRFGGMIGSTISAFARENDTPINETEILIRSVMTERELVEGEGFVYVRLPIQDHTWPTPEVIDDFIRLVRDLDSDQTWLHFHCQAGKGRTGVMMMIYDMMRNPDAAMEDIVIRQTMLGGSYPLYTENSDSYKVPLYAEKARMTPLFYAYVQEEHRRVHRPLERLAGRHRGGWRSCIPAELTGGRNHYETEGNNSLSYHWRGYCRHRLLRHAMGTHITLAKCHLCRRLKLRQRNDCPCHRIHTSIQPLQR